MIWQRKRLTKKNKQRERPKRIAFLSLTGLTVVALLVIALSVITLTHQPMLVMPVPFANQLKDVLGTTQEATVSDVEKMLRDKQISYLFVTTATDAAYIVTLTDNSEVLMKEDHLDGQIASLQLITRRLTMEGKRFTRLDLRFDRPVIVLR